MTIRFFHTADIHFGVENYGKIDPATGIHTRLLDFKKSLETCVDHAIEQKADFFLFCGDAYKTAHPTPTQQKLLLQLLLKLQQAQIPVVIVVGNHDHPLSFGKAHSLDVFSDLPLAGLHVFSKPGILKLETKNGPVNIVGIPWPMRHNVVAHEIHRFKTAHEITSYLSDQIGKLIATYATELDPHIPAVLAGHLTVSSGVFSGSEKCAIFGNDPIFMPSQLAINPFDYVALGHLHRHQNLNPGGIPIVYSGSIDRVDFGERKETKGYCIVSIDATPEKKTCSYEFVPLKTRPFLQVEVMLEAGRDQTEKIIEALKEYDITDAVIKIVYHIPDGKLDKVDLLAVQRAATAAMYIASITPVHKPAVRERRPLLNVNMDLGTLLSKYFESKSFDKKAQEELLKKADTLIEEIEFKKAETEANTY